MAARVLLRLDCERVGPRRSIRRAMTLVELLVVIAVIGMLVAILLPAVQQAREAGRRSQCVNHLKQIGLALHNYESTFNVWPRQATGPTPGAAYNEPRHSWMTLILPFMEQPAVFELYNQKFNWHDAENAAAVSTRLPIFLCPSTPERDGFEWTVLVSYANATTTTATLGPRSIYPGRPTDYTNLGGISSALNNSLPTKLQLVDPANSGVLKGTGVRLNEVLDGLSNTALVAECAGRPKLYQMNRPVSDGSMPKTWSGSASVTRPLPTGGVWASHSKGFLIDGAHANGYTNTSPGGCAVNCSNDNEIYSFHPGGANVLVADGSVRFLSQTTAIPVLVAIVSRAGGEATAID